jgi:hypothetical protein
MPLSSGDGVVRHLPRGGRRTVRQGTATVDMLSPSAHQRGRQCDDDQAGDRSADQEPPPPALSGFLEQDGGIANGRMDRWCFERMVRLGEEIVSPSF